MPNIENDPEPMPTGVNQSTSTSPHEAVNGHSETEHVKRPNLTTGVSNSRHSRRHRLYDCIPPFPILSPSLNYSRNLPPMFTSNQAPPYLFPNLPPPLFGAYPGDILPNFDHPYF